MIGPRVRRSLLAHVSIKLSCASCELMRHVHRFPMDMFVCDHAQIGGRDIGETAATPAWCPVREDALGQAVLSALGIRVDETPDPHQKRAEFYVGAPFRSEVLELTGTVTAIKRHGAEAELEIVFDGCAPDWRAGISTAFRTVSVALNRVELPCIIG